MKNQKYKFFLLILSIVIIVIHLTEIDWTNLSILNNLGSYSGIIAMVCFIAVFIISIKKDRKKKIDNNELQQ